MVTGMIALLLIIMVIFKVFAMRSGAKNIPHAIDYWLTAIYGKKRFEKRAAKHGFLDVYQKELEFQSIGLITQMQCFNSFRSAKYKHRSKKT